MHRPLQRIRRATTGVLIATGIAAGAASAQQVDPVIDAGNQRTRVGQKAQDQIDELADQKRDLSQQYRAVLREIEGLEIYNQQLERQIAAQENEIVELDQSIDRATEIDRQVLPLMLRMIGGLDQFIGLDVPFLERERSERLAFLESLVDRADVTVAEKFRRVLEAYQIEGEYGRTIEAYRDEVEIDGQPREVEVLRIGRVGLFYQTLDGGRQAAWDIHEGQWVELGGGYARPIQAGIRMAKKQVAPDLLMLPLAAPREAQ